MGQECSIWAPELLCDVDPTNRHRLVIKLPGLDSNQWFRIGAAFVLPILGGLSATFGVGGIHGESQYIIGPVVFLAGVLGIHLQLRELRRWCSIELRGSVWRVEIGCGRIVAQTAEINLAGAATRVETDDTRAWAVLSSHLVLYDSLARYDEPLPQIRVGERLNYYRLDVIGRVVEEQSEIARANQARVK